MVPLIIFTSTEIIGATAVSFVIGFALGVIVARKTPGSDKTDIQLRIAIFITIIWSVSVIATIIVNDYETSIWVHAIMGAITGYLFGVDNPLTGGANG